MLKALFQSTIYELGMGIANPFFKWCLSRFGKALFIFNLNADGSIKHLFQHII